MAGLTLRVTMFLIFASAIQIERGLGSLQYSSSLTSNAPRSRISRTENNKCVVLLEFRRGENIDIQYYFMYEANVDLQKVEVH